MLEDEFQARRPMWLKLLFHLVSGPHTPTELAALENAHLSDVCRGLARLRRDGLAESTPGGSRKKYYKPTKDGLVFAYTHLSKNGYASGQG